MKLDRVNDISPETFVNDYIIPSRPVIITDAMGSFRLDEFVPERLKEAHGNNLIQVYDDLFTLQSVDKLENYIRKNFNQTQSGKRQYARGYSKLKDVKYFWSDGLFDSLSASWKHPGFFPTSSFLVPFVPEDQLVDVTHDYFPYRGIFISGKGAKTRLHIDPFNSDALLCQFYGHKSLSLYHPDQLQFLQNEQGEIVDCSNPDPTRFPNFHQATPAFEDELLPGEIVYFPNRWAHEVVSMDDSVSITWNFVHSANKQTFFEHLTNHPEDDQFQIVQFFLQNAVQKGDSVEKIIEKLNETFL